MQKIQYGPGKKRITQLLRRSSSLRAAALLLVMFACVTCALLVRLFVLEPVRVNDGSMRPEISSEARIWICKLPICVDRSPFSSPLLAHTRGNDRVLRWKLGEPGDQLILGPLGRVQLRGRLWNWRREHTIIDEQNVYVPRKGDTLHLDSLDPMAFDFATKIYRSQWPKRHTWVVATLWNGDQPIPLSEVGRTSIGNRPVAQNEVPGLPWQELRLLELQLQRIEASSSPIRFRRRFYADSTQVKKFVVTEDCWFLVCSRGSLCADSRDEGFFRRSEIIGAPLPFLHLAPVSPMSQAKGAAR